MRRLARSLTKFVLITWLLACPAAAQRTLNFRAVNTQFEVTLPDQPLAGSDSDLQAYITQGATAVAKYFGHFPMKRVFINIRVVDGNRVRFGRSSPQNGGTIMLLVGRDAKGEAFTHDWTLTHEMVHLAFPATKGDNHEWLGEGMATYVEPIARAQSGFITAQEVWRQFIDYMPRGIPGPNDGGIDNAHGFRRIYWGGALFCLLADIQIRKQTHNRKGLQDAFRAIMKADGTMEWEWDINTIFETGDRATGTHVLESLYANWKDHPVTVDLEQLWRDLGVERQNDKNDSVVFHDNAPLAAIRKAITTAR
jgi:hypothetical protein